MDSRVFRDWEEFVGWRPCAYAAIRDTATPPRQRPGTARSGWAGDIETALGEPAPTRRMESQAAGGPRAGASRGAVEPAARAHAQLACATDRRRRLGRDELRRRISSTSRHIHSSPRARSSAVSTMAAAWASSMPHPGLARVCAESVRHATEEEPVESWECAEPVAVAGRHIDARAAAWNTVCSRACSTARTPSSTGKRRRRAVSKAATSPTAALEPASTPGPGAEPPPIRCAPEASPTEATPNVHIRSRRRAPVTGAGRCTAGAAGTGMGGCYRLTYERPGRLPRPLRTPPPG
jgi:hypothetical protein